MYIEHRMFSSSICNTKDGCNYQYSSSATGLFPHRRLCRFVKVRVKWNIIHHECGVESPAV